jgi:GH24 family phage-related lysozyme (muramidase)
MNIQGGGLSFEISGSNDKLLSVLNESKKAIQNFSTAAVSGGKGIDRAFENAAAAIEKGFADIDRIVDTNKASLAKLQEEYKRLSSEAAKAFSEARDADYRRYIEAAKNIQSEITLREKLINEAQASADQLLQEEKALKKQKETAEKNVSTQISLRTQLRNVREELALLEANGQRGTEAFKKLQQEAGRLTDAIGDATTQARIFSHDNRGLQGMISGLSGVVGAFSAAQGAVALFAGENENLQKVMLKVQSLMSITIGLQQVANTINKDSAFMLTTVAKAKELLAAATNKLTIALGGSTIAAKALMATLTLGLSVAITVIIAALSKLQSKQAEAKKAQEEFNKKVSEAAGKPVAAYRALQTEWISLSGSLKEREKWVQNNADKFKELGFSVRDAKEAEELLVSNSSKFVEAMMLRAKAAATSELAIEKYKAVIEAQNKLDATPKAYVSKKGTYTDGYGVKRKGTVLEKSDTWKEAEETLEKAEAEYNKLINLQVNFTQQEKQILAQIGNQAGQIIAGSVEAAEKELARLQELYKKAGSDKERASLKKQIEAQQKEVNRISLSSGNGSKQSDPYLDMLTKRKEKYADYLKWVTSKDETLRKAANTEFATLLKEGTSYLDYLEKKRADIQAKATKTTTDLKNLSTLNNEIAKTTKEAVISDFDKKLQEELAACQTIGARLDLLEQRRKELSGDNSDVDNAKKDIIDDAKKDTVKQAKEETKQLLREYAGYLSDKLDFEESYAWKKQAITDKLAKATTSKDKQVAEAALAALEKKRAEYSKLTGNEQYDQLLQQYKTYQQQQTEIMKTYAAQRVEAEKQGNIAMIAQINAKEQAELSKLAASRLMASESWNQLFSDLSTLTTNTINKLITDINSKKVSLSAQFNPADLKAINDQLEKAKDELHERNPFLALKDSLAELRAAMKADKLLESDDPFVKSLEERKKQYQAYTDTINSGDEILAGAAKEAFAELLSEGSSYVDYLRRKIAELNKQKATIKLTVEGEEQLAVLNAALSKEEGTTKSVSAAFKESFKSIGSSIDLVSGAFDSVVSGIKKMGVSMDEETDAILGDIGGMLEGAGQFAAGYASMNPVQMVSGAVGFLSSAFDLFNTRDRKAEKSIKKHQEAVTKLGYAYNALEHAVDSALGETVYQNQNAMIQNMRAQQNEIQGMINDEISKKKTDWGRVDEFREQYAEAGRQIEDLIKEITESITQTSATELADELANALVEAFEGGENAAKAFGEVANDVIKNAVVNALKLQFLEQPLQKAIKQLQKDMGFDEEGNGSFNGLTETEQARFKQAIQAAGANFAAAMDMYKDLFEQLDEDDPSTLSGAIKGASQESIDLLAGQTNAVRVNQVTSLQLLRQQLTHLANMDTTLGVISGRLLTIINKITNTPTDDLRSQGITD